MAASGDSEGGEGGVGDAWAEGEVEGGGLGVASSYAPWFNVIQFVPSLAYDR